MTERVDVRLPGGRGYPILIGDGLLDDPAVLAEHVGKRALLVTNAAVASRFLEPVRRGLAASQVDVFTLGDGERFKNLESYAAVLDALVAKRHDRGTTVVALGGGVVGDVAGFAAATYQRGVAFVQVPTTLLAQVDSSVGGKTAVNHPAGKNLIGAFHQPRAVIADIQTLRTLPTRDRLAGLAEVIKYGVVADAAFFEWLEANIAKLRALDAAATLRAVRRSCELKAEVVAADERERGRRAILNFGHTFGHALEAATGYNRYLHGEAVAIGMAMAMRLSVRLGRAAPADAERVYAILDAAGLPLAARRVSGQAVLDAMAMDKKVSDGRVRLVVARGVGEVELTADAPRPAVLEAINAGIGG